MYNIENFTLKEIKEGCEKHHRQNRDCESCTFYRFCGYDMIQRDPSAWRLSQSDYKED